MSFLPSNKPDLGADHRGYLETYKSVQGGGGPKIDKIERTCFLNGPYGHFHELWLQKRFWPKAPVTFLLSASKLLVIFLARRQGPSTYLMGASNTSRIICLPFPHSPIFTNLRRGFLHLAHSNMHIFPYVFPSLPQRGEYSFVHGLSQSIARKII